MKSSSYFERNKIRAVMGHYEVDGRRLDYASIGEDHLPALLFLHGSPGSMKDFLHFYTDTCLTEKFSIYAVDRPGYGLTKGTGGPHMQNQAQMISVLAERIHRVHQPLLIAAQGYGALVAARMTMDHPKIVQGLVLLDMSLKAKSNAGIFSLLRQIFFPVSNSGSSAIARIEEGHHKNEVKKMLPLWKNIKVPVLCLYSEKTRQSKLEKEFLMQHLSQLNAVYLQSRKGNLDWKKEISRHISNMFQWMQPH